MNKENVDGYKPSQLREDDIFSFKEHYTFSPLGSKLQSIFVSIAAFQNPKASDTRLAQIREEVDRQCREMGISIEEVSGMKSQFDEIVKKRIDALSDIGIGSARTLSFRVQRKLKHMASFLQNLPSLRIHIVIDKKM